MVKLVADPSQLPPLKARDRRRDENSSAEAKKIILATVRMGGTVAEGCRQARRSVKSYEYYRKTDPDFRELIDRARISAAERAEGNRIEVPPFPDFSERYLDTRLFRHQLQWYDLVEGREPRDLRPNQRFIQGDPDMVVINTPPDHSKALSLDTVLTTPLGWTTIGDLRVGDRVFGPDGKPTTVVAKSEIFNKPCSKVSFNHGETFTASDDHLWTVVRNRREVTVTTRELRVGDRLPFHSELHMEPARYDLDPYLLGCWLGDGHTASGRFTSADQEIVDAFAAYEPRQYSKYSYETTGLFRQLAELGLIGRKKVPEGYMLGSAEQRLALLQGLMDTDGTISTAGQASFTSTNRGLAEGVLYLASSLGLRPTIKESRATCNGKDCGPKWTVWFSPCGQPVFRLPRKLRRVRVWANPDRHTTAVARTVKAVEPTEQVPTQCIRVDNDSHLFLIGRGLVPTHNSTTITTNYVTWRIVQDPNIRILIISKTREMACKFLLAIKERLSESETYSDLQEAFGPPGGFADGSSWTQDRIYVAGRTSGEKDPTVQALGIRGHIYGARADLVIMDDCVTLDNVREYEKQIEWIQKEVGSRVASTGGRMLLVGTRMDTADLYSEVLKSKYYSEESSPWTYLTQPAVEEYAEDPKDWKTLWPVTNRPPVTIAARKEAERAGWPREGLWAAKDGPSLAKERRRVSPRTWSLVYMQEQVSDDAVFPEEDVIGCIDNARYAGRMGDGQPQHRKHGMDGLYVVAGLDPADVGYTAAVVVGLDRRTGVRWVLDVFNKQGCKPHEMRRMIKEKTERFQINEWRVEKNAFQGSLTQDEEIRSYLAARGCVLTGHFTDARKWDPNFGVSSMAPLFAGWREGNNLIRLPSRYNSEGSKALVEQLVTWVPVPVGHKVTGHWDTVMSLWFAEIRCRELMFGGLDQGWHLQTGEFTSARDVAGQMVVDIDFALQQQGAGAWDGAVGW